MLFWDFLKKLIFQLKLRYYCKMTSEASDQQPPREARDEGNETLNVNLQASISILYKLYSIQPILYNPYGARSRHFQPIMERLSHNLLSRNTLPPLYKISMKTSKKFFLNKIFSSELFGFNLRVKIDVIEKNERCGNKRGSYVKKFRKSLGFSSFGPNRDKTSK